MIATVAELDRIRRESRRMVAARSLAAAGVAVVPVPAVDVLADLGLLGDMLPRISRAFQLDHESIEKLPPDVAQRALAVAAGLGNNVIGRLVTRKLVVALLRRVGVRVASASVAKYVPVIGSVVAASIGFGAMKLAGDAHVEDCYRTARALLPADA